MSIKVRISPNIVRRTSSVCPVCLKRLPADVVRRGNEHFIEKTCPEHGFYSTVVWRGENPSYLDWGSGYTASVEDENSTPDCPGSCGVCPGHLQKTCCAIVEVTNQCNLRCPVCFAGSGDGTANPSISELYSHFKKLVGDGNTFIQLSGGEPTVRTDLIDIIASAREAGCESIQLNTNGIRLAEDRLYAKALHSAGLSFVFMQFDGTDDEINVKLRGRYLLAEKKAAIENCAEALLGVTLVPTLVPGINVHNIGEIIDFGFSSSPAVRGVHFQPICYLGRFPHRSGNENRITLPEVLRAIGEQTGGKLGISDFAPSRCDHPYCGFHGDFVVLPKKAVMKLTRKNNAPCCGDDSHLKSRNFVARRWNRSEISEADCCDDDDFNELSAFAKRIKSHGFTITAMAFQDAYNLDIERLRRCSLHVSELGDTIDAGFKLTPFCAKYLT